MRDRRAPPPRPQVPYLGGRNFIESIVYTLTYLEFQRRLETRTENLSLVVAELERQLCGLARAIPTVKQFYHSYVKKTLEEHYKDYPLPEIGPACQVRQTLIEWFKSNKRKLFKKSLMVRHPSEIDAEIVRIVDSILYEAIFGALYKAGILSHA